MATKNDPCIETLELSSINTLKDSVLDDVHRVDTDDDDTAKVYAGTPQKRSSEKIVQTKAEKEFYQLLKNLPKELKGKIDHKQMKKIFENAKSIGILVTGKSGSGKSTLVNGILGVTLPGDRRAQEGSSICKPCTSDVKAYYTKKDNIHITVWDSPGLQDGTGNKRYLQQMKEKCGERDLTMYCIDARPARFLSGLDDNPDIVAFKKLTEEFGPQFWSNTVIVLTFFNCIADDVHIRYLETEEEKTEAVEAKLQEWKDQIVHILTHDVKIDRQVAEKIPIVPAGYYREPHLPVCKFWLSNLWFQCLATVSTREGQIALLRANFNRMKNKTDVQTGDFKKPLEQQPILFDDEKIQTIMRALRAVSGSIALGGTIGAIAGIAGGPVGVLVGMVVGATIGAAGGTIASLI